jgi:hypothetical protein
MATGTSSVRIEELPFAGRRDAAINGGETKKLIMVAPARALGMIHRAYLWHLREHRAPRSIRISSTFPSTKLKRTWPGDTTDVVLSECILS